MAGNRTPELGTITSSREPSSASNLRFKVFIGWTVVSALAVWLSLSVLEGLAQERCQSDGQLWRWTSWSCVQPSGTIVLPSALRRALLDDVMASSSRA